MANTINLGNNNISAFKVGVNDVSYIYLGTTLVYQSHDYESQYLTFVAQESGTFKLSGNGINYSLDSGSTWTLLASDTDSPTVQSGNTILWKASLTPSSSGIGTFSSTGAFKVEGNIMSLLYRDNFSGQTSLSGKDYAFRDLFYNCSGLTSAENLVLPATTLSQHCYEFMFYNCSGLTTAPELPATTLADSCYRAMFNGCLSLNNITCLATDISASQCTVNWVNGVSASGTFTKAANMNDWTTGVNGIPSGWTVQDYPPQYRTTSGTSYCSGSTGTDKYVDVYSQVSYNAGVDWQTTATTPTLIEEHSADCGYASRSVSGTPYCSGGSKVVDVDFQESYDSGSTWVTVSSSTTMVQRCSSDCGCSGCSDMFCGVDINGNDYVVSFVGLTSLGETDFTVGSNVVEGEVGEPVITIGEYCFREIASTLSALTIGDNVTTIEHEAFMETSHLETLTIPSGVTEIDFWAFTRCSSLQEVIFENPQVYSRDSSNWAAFHGNYPPVIYVPDNSVSDYRSMGISYYIDDVSEYPDINTWIQPISNRT